VNPWWMLLLNMVIGSAIGGVTNKLAIRMLFRPYREWRIGSIRVPFTPGLIPRRRDEIARQMGRLVEQYLFTAEGMKKAIAQTGLERTLAQWLESAVEDWLQREETGRDVLLRLFPAALTEAGEWSEWIRQPLQARWKRLVRERLDELADRPLESFLTAEGKVRLYGAVAGLTPLFLDRMAEYLRSEEGQRDLQQMVRGLLGGGGGMLSGLMSMFLGDDKILGKILPHLEEMLRHPELARKLSGFLQQEVEKLLIRPAGELLKWIGEEQIAGWTEEGFRRLESKSQDLLDQPLAQLLRPLQPLLSRAQLERAAAWTVQWLLQHVERLFAKLSVAQIVKEQVESFPVERVEEMIIGITGKEFRMITLLGFLLGGMIGLVQGLINLWS